MKKYFVVFVSALMVLGFPSIVRASGIDDGSYRGLQDFAIFQNSNASTITSNSLVVLDVSTGVAGSTLGYNITVSATGTSAYQIGITDEDIKSGERGRVCIRGPHLVKFWSGDSAITAGANVGPSDHGVGYAEATTGTSTTNGAVGYGLAAKNTTNSQDMWWVWVDPTNQ